MKTIFGTMEAGNPRPGYLSRMSKIRYNLPVILVVLTLLGMASNAHGDPDYQGQIIYGLDPVLTGTDNPRLLGVQRLVIRQRLLNVGVDPFKDAGKRPELIDSFRKVWIEKSGFDLERKKHLVEYNGLLGLVTTIEYPKFFFLFPVPETLPGGIIYYPPRPMDDAVVKVFVDDIEAGAARARAVDRMLVMDKLLGGDRVGKVGQDDGLINLTIPIKLPRTLEKIIGRGEKTRIKITGRERISISGESTVVNPFIPSERVSSQSLFPSLDMEQELQVNLSGVIGEKIIIEVDHNSAALGPDATKIKLMYQGGEDEIIKTIETGDVGLTLPGSRLLGYSSNKSGLFGIKVTGQVGRADFTTVVSKQKAESSSKTFNSKGGEVEDIIILSGNYLNQRFFRLDLPFSPYYPVADDPGRNPGTQTIDPSSIKIYKMMGVGPEGDRDVRNVAAYVDPTGTFWEAPGSPVPDFSDPYTYATRWRELDYDLMLDNDGNMVAIDMRSQMLNEDVLAVVYTVVDADGDLLYRIGDRPGINDDSRVSLPNEDQLYYRMKLLKAPVNQKEPFTFYYVLRNIYSLGGGNIDIDSFDLRIERNVTSDPFPYQDENEVNYIEIFGLDRENAQHQPIPDGVVDKTDATVFDLRKGLLKFPLDFPTPFNAGFDAYHGYSADLYWDAAGDNPSDAFLKTKQHGELYNPDILPSDYHLYNSFRLVARHAATASSFNLGVSNIEEGSEVVTIDGRTLVNGVDYEIDYTFGQIELKGDAANLSADSKVSVTYQYAPFFGGGQTNLLGFNVNYDLGRESTLATTWLYQSESIVGEKAKLGEEPSKTLVGNLLLGHTFKPYFLTHVANFLSLRNTERESSIQFNAEAAISLPNPNTKGNVYLEDFEGVDASDIISLTRIGWSWGAQPFLGERHIMQTGDSRQFLPENRVDNVRWFIPKERTERRMLNPALINQERGETQQVMDLYLRDDDGVWDADNWGGITRGLSRTGIDLSKAQFIEIWVNDGVPELTERSGKLHIDFGYINEDGFWPLADVDDPDSRVVGQHEQEDGIIAGTEADGVFSHEEDIGLDGHGDTGPQQYLADFDIGGDSPYPFINGTARNSREDDEDINKSGSLDRDDGYFTAVIDLQDTEALVDVVYDYESDYPGDVSDLRDEKIAWRKYRIRVGDIDSVSVGIQPNIQAITHTRIWFEDGSPTSPSEPVHLQLSEFKFLGSRWEREGVRETEGEVLLEAGERLPGEEFFLGEVNNKENPDYHSPFSVHEVQNIPEKEQALVLDFRNLQQGHMVRASKQVSPRGDDYTAYREMSWYWFNPSESQADLDLFFRVGSDTLNYYEVNYKFADSVRTTDWKFMAVNIAELSNVKNGEVDENGDVHGTVRDTRTSDVYQVRVVGLPDLRKVRRYSWVVANNDLSQEASGYFYLNDVKLEGVKTDMGMAQSFGVGMNMADVFKLDFDWSKTDAEFHGLDKRTGSGQTGEGFGVSTNFNVNDFIPLGGFKLPVSGSRRQSVVRPKYETNSDIEILDTETRNALSEVETQERFSARLNKSPSKGAIPRYLVDPWVVLATGSRSTNRGPLDERDQKNLSGSLNFDLRIPGKYQLGDYPILGYLPIIKGINIVPSKVALGASFTSTYNSHRTINQDGSITQRPITKTRPATLKADFEYDPMSVLRFSLGGTSERDLLREHLMYGVNIGMENKRIYDVRMTISPPAPKAFPGGALFYPFRAAARAMKVVKPSIQFTGSFVDDHNPNIAQLGDPIGTRNINNSNRWDLRGSFPLGKLFKNIVPEKKHTKMDQKTMAEKQLRYLEREMRDGGGSGEIEYPPEWADLPPDEEARLKEEFLAEQYQKRMDEERANNENQSGGADEDSGPGFGLITVYNAVFEPLRKLKPIKITFSEDRSSGYGRIYLDTPFWYKAGFETNLDIPDSTYMSYGFQSQQTINLSTSTQIARSISLDLKYNQRLSDRLQAGSSTRSYQQDWPDASIALGGLEKWRIFGGGGKELDSGWFRSSNISLSYKNSKTVNNITPISYNPSTSTTINPRWSFNFHSGLNATLTTTIGNDRAVSNGVITEKSLFRVGLQVRHQFKAQAFLAKMGLYRPGSNPSINMDVDISYSEQKSERFNPGSLASTPTGMGRYGINPRFSYQVTRNLSGALTFTFNRNKDLATDLTSTSLGLGVEATFVF